MPYLDHDEPVDDDSTLRNTESSPAVLGSPKGSRDRSKSLAHELDPREHVRRILTYQQRLGRPRWVLHSQAVFWRTLMNLGMFFHRLAPPRPPRPDFSRTIQSTIGVRPGPITLHFYVPKDYAASRQHWNDAPTEISGAIIEEEDEDEEDQGEEAEKNVRLNMMASTVGQSLRSKGGSFRKWGGYPVVINFHGGGFTLGSAIDDARWCGTVVDECNAVVVSVDYRLAPECPFPTAVDDGADAVMYINEHADEFGIDKDKIALSGFSSGANMCFTVPLRLHDERDGFPRDDDFSTNTVSRPGTAESIEAHQTSFIPPQTSASTESASMLSSYTADGPDSSQVHILDPKADSSSPRTTRMQKAHTFETITETSSRADLKIRCIIPWYPPVDYTRTREQRRATCKRADQELPALFTDLFDDSYLHPPHTISLDSPYLSPGVAPTSLLRNALPHEIIMHTCEWDMLLDEGEAFRDRLSQPDIGKNVVYHMIPDVPHGWDKAPNPWKPTPGVKEHYLRACREIRRVMGPGPRPMIERISSAGPSAAPRGSISVVR